MDAHALRPDALRPEDHRIGGTPPEGAIASLPAQESSPTLLYGNLEIRPDEIQVLADGGRVGLTVREFQVFLVLAEHEDRVVRRTEIYSRVWGGEMKRRDRSVDVFVRKVRNKLARACPEWEYIHTHFGVGYRFAAVPSTGRDLT
ncbi:MAG: winged helix-turn-helix domain-containing protein [Solirubrobacterales bacterium]